METGFILNTKEGYYKSGNTRTKNIERAKVYKELSFLCKYAVFPYFVKDNRVVEGVQLIRIGKDDNGDIVAACDLGELWSCLQMYNMGYEAAKYHYTCGNN